MCACVRQTGSVAGRVHAVYAVVLASYVRKSKQDRSVVGIDIGTFKEKLIDKAQPLSWERPQCSVLHTASDGKLLYYAAHM